MVAVAVHLVWPEEMAEAVVALAAPQPHLVEQEQQGKATMAVPLAHQAVVQAVVVQV